MQDLKTYGLLLKKTLLANDDAVLDFFTGQEGRVSCFVARFARSKKKAQEVDFFRLLELELTKKRTSCKLKGVTTLHYFPQFDKSYRVNQGGFEILSTLISNTVADKSDPVFFKNVVQILGHLKPDNLAILRGFFEIKLFDYQGILPRFDTLRGDVYLDLFQFVFSSKNRPNAVFIPQLERQVIELMRRSDFETFQAKLPNLDPEVLGRVVAIIQKMRECHA